ncbi:MAG: hypothetical protein FWG42_02610 [Clostridiales bacterium]|nr:hypothetical protein [Clostridiales bacterium]
MSSNKAIEQRSSFEVFKICTALKSEAPKIESWESAIPEFKRFNIVENEVRNVV